MSIKWKKHSGNRLMITIRFGGVILTIDLPP